MAENLNYETENSSCYNNYEDYCAKYGRFYSWNEANKACPTGWHLPSKSEFETLVATAGGKFLMNKMLMSANGWSGIDNFSFSALPAGYLSSRGLYDDEGDAAYFWSSTDAGKNGAYRLKLKELYYYSSLDAVSEKSNYNHSVRCVKD